MIKAAAFLIDMYAAQKIAVSFATNGSGKILENGGAAEEDYLGILRTLSGIENECDTYFTDFCGCIDFDEITDIAVVTPYIDERMIDFARAQKRLGRNVFFYCNDETDYGHQVIHLGRIHRYTFLKD